MSSGVFSTVKYTSDVGYVYPAKAQAETIAFAVGATTNASAAGAIIPGTPSARLNGSKRMIGVNARSVTAKFNGAGPAGYKDGSTLRIPIFTKATWDAIAKGAAGTYLGVGVTIVGKNAEDIV